MKLGVVIQGPLITYGQGPNNSSGGFNSYGTILENIERMSKYDLCYIVSTWIPSSKQEQHIINALENARVLIIQNLSPTIFDPDHRYKQHFGVLRGTEALLGMYGNVTHLVKIRTDMLMPEAFWEWACAIIGKNDEKLYISELMYRPFYQGDFIYLANRQVLLEFLTTVVNYKSRIIHPSIALDMGIKGCEARNFENYYGCGLYGRIKFLVDFIFRTSLIRMNWNKFISKYVGVLPESIWIAIKWRDRDIGSFLNSESFKFDTSEITRDLKFFVNIGNLAREYKIYLAKCLRNWMK